MNNIGTTPTQNLPNLVTPFTTPSKVAVGLETAEMKDVAVPPVEQSSESARSLNRRQLGDKSVASDDNRVDAVADDEDGNQQQQDAEEQEKQAVIRQLAARDREVRQHEAAHSAVGGALAGAPQFNYVRGPDGVLYAQSGEVSISIPPASGEPEEVIQNAEKVQRAALAPAEPSPQDRSVAAQAAQIAQQARAQFAAQTAAEARGEEDQSEDSEGAPKTESVTAADDVSAEEKLRQEEEQKARRLEALAEEQREQDARREEARRAANAERFMEIQNTPIVPVNDLTQRILGLNNIEQGVKVGSVLDKLV